MQELGSAISQALRCSFTARPTNVLLAQLLNEEENDSNLFESPWKGIGLPREPRIDELACSLCQWSATGNLQYLGLEDFAGFQQNREDYEKLQSLHPSLAVCFQDLPPLDEEGKLKSVWNSFFENLTARHILTLLRVRSTTGSVAILPPPREQLLAAFQVLHCNRPGVNLTCGARALSKHAHRASDGFWGEMKVGPCEQRIP